MALSKTYYSTMNRALDDVTTTTRVASSTLFALKEFLMGGISGTNGPEGARPSSAYWTLVQNCDSVTVNTSGTDLLGGATYDNTKWVRANGAAHTWYVLKSPSGMMDSFWYLTVDWNATTDQTCNFVLSRTLPSGGTTSARPTTTNEVLRANIFAEASANAAKTHFITDANGNFWFLESRNGQGYFQFGMGVQELVEARSSGDSARVAMLTCQAVANRGAWDFVGNGNNAAFMLTNTGTPPTANQTKILLPQGYSAAATTTYSNVNTNSIDSKVDRLPIFYIYDNTASSTGVRGRVPDVFIGSSQVAVGSTEPSSGTPEEMCVGGIWIPCSVAPSL